MPARELDPDWETRKAAFSALDELVARNGPVLTLQTLRAGFVHRGEHVHFLSKAQGIFKPARMRTALSVLRTPPPRPGRAVRYADDRGDEEIRSDAPFRYDFQSGERRRGDNQTLIGAAEYVAPIILFYGVQEGWYRPLYPALVEEVDEGAGVFHISVQPDLVVERPVLGAGDAKRLEIQRRYATVLTKRRLHQDVFRHRVLLAYAERCAVCRLPRRELVEAAHILPDRDERGRPEIPNGLALCALHHTTFDADLLGISPDGVIRISPGLMAATDGATLEHALKGFQNAALHLPRLQADAPRRDYLAERYERFQAAS